MTQEPYYCPIEGCNYGHGEQKSLAAVRSHINATTDTSDQNERGHSWAALKTEVEQQGEESDEEQTEATENEENEDTDMDEEEYVDQYEQPAEDEEEDADADTGSDGVPKKLIAGVVVAVVIAGLLWYLFSGDSSAESAPESPEASGSSTDQTTETAAASGDGDQHKMFD